MYDQCPGLGLHLQGCCERTPVHFPSARWGLHTNVFCTQWGCWTGVVLVPKDPMNGQTGLNEENLRR